MTQNNDGFSGVGRLKKKTASLCLIVWNCFFLSERLRLLSRFILVIIHFNISQ